MSKQPQGAPQRMFLTNTDYITGANIVQMLGVVRGSTIRVRWFGADFVANLRTIFGGEVPEYTSLMEQARNDASQRMIANAAAMGASAVINVRYTTAAVMKGAAEILVYGTAVKMAPISG